MLKPNRLVFRVRGVGEARAEGRLAVVLLFVVAVLLITFARISS